MLTLHFAIDQDNRAVLKSTEDMNITTETKGVKNWVQGRQYEDSMRQAMVYVTHEEDGTPFDLTDVNPWFEGVLPDGKHRILDAKHGVLIDPVGGQFRFDFPKQAFAVFGSYKQAFFRLEREGSSISTLEIDFSVLSDDVISGLIPSDYITPFEDLYAKLEDILANADGDLKSKLATWTTQFTDLMTKLSQQGTDTSNMLANVQTTLKNLETQIASNGLLKQADVDEQLKKVTDVFGNLSDLKISGDTLTKKIETEFDNRGVNIENYGAACDGVTDDSKALQLAIDYCFEQGLQLFVPKKQIAVDNPVYLPINTSQEKSFIYDFNGATFIVPANNDLFISGYKDGETYIKTTDKEDGPTTYNFNTKLCNFQVIGSRRAMQLAFWHQGCSINNISMWNAQTALIATSCYYTNIVGVATRCLGKPSDNAERFIFKGVNNLMTIENCIASESVVGYSFDAYNNSMSSIRFLNNSVEGTDTGIKVNAQMYNCEFDGTYAESVSNYVFDFSGVQTISGTTISNSWVHVADNANFRFINNMAWNNTNRINITSDNHFQGEAWKESMMFANLTYGGGIRLQKPNVNLNYNDMYSSIIESGTYPTNLFLDQIFAFGKDEDGATAGFGRINNGAQVGAYTGRMGDGTAESKLLGVTVPSAYGGKIILQTALIPSKHQIFLFGLSANSTKSGDYSTLGIVAFNRYYEFTNSGVALNSKVTVDLSQKFVIINLIDSLVDFDQNAVTVKDAFVRLI